MKKLVIFALLILVIVPVTALAAPQTIDLDTMSYAELLKLSQSVDQAMMNYPEWKGVFVPEGKYVIGTDIPAGTYMVSHGSSEFGINFFIFETEDGANYYSDAEPIGLMTFQEGEEAKYLKVATGNSIAVYYGSLYFKPFTLGF